MNLPNKLTLSRLGLAILVVIVLLSNALDSYLRNYVSSIIFLIGIFTDFLDGYIARKRDEITVFGTFADPLADKILISTSLILLVYLNRLSPLVAIALIERDNVMTGLRLIGLEQRVIIPAQLTGKIKMVFESILVVDLLFNWEISYLKLILIILSLFFAYLSLIITLWKYKNLFKNIY